MMSKCRVKKEPDATLHRLFCRVASADGINGLNESLIYLFNLRLLHLTGLHIGHLASACENAAARARFTRLLLGFGIARGRLRHPF